MGLQFPPLPPTVCLDDLGSIKSDALEWVNSDQYNAAVGIDTVLGVAIANGMKNFEESSFQSCM